MGIASAVSHETQGYRWVRYTTRFPKTFSIQHAFVTSDKQRRVSIETPLAGNSKSVMALS
jgi:hypothetical protein